MKLSIAIATVSLTIFSVTRGQTISCPILTCGSADSLEMDQCFQHDDQHPVQTIRTFACEEYLESTLKGTPLCELNLPKG